MYIQHGVSAECCEFSESTLCLNDLTFKNYFALLPFVRGDAVINSDKAMSLFSQVVLITVYKKYKIVYEKIFIMLNEVFELNVLCLNVT